MSEVYHHKALPEGSILREWRLERVLGVGGFGIVYQGRGVYFDEQVAIKEYFPGAISDRQDGVTVTPTDSSSEEVYQLGLKKFVDEAKVLWSLSSPRRHPNIVSVRSLFEINGTAYMVMDFESGASLAQMLRQGRRFEEAELRAIVAAIGGGLERAHLAGVIHRDIKPANILIDQDGRPVLIDFGSARLESGQATSTRVTFHTPPYAALEQYVKTYPQGPWTDIYALGVTIYQCVTGEKPPDVLERMNGEAGEPLAARDRPGFSRAFALAVDAAMAIRPAERPQSITDWLGLFDLAAPADDDLTRIAIAPPPVPGAAEPPAVPLAPDPTPVPLAPDPTPVPLAPDPTPVPLAPDPTPVPPATPAAAAAGARQGPAARTIWIGAGVTAAALAGVGAVVLLLAPRARPTASPAAPTTAAAPAPASPQAARPTAAAASPSVQGLVDGAQGMAAEARGAGLPAAEVAGLERSSARISALAAQIRTAPPAAAPPVVAQLDAAALELARRLAAALGRAAREDVLQMDRILGPTGAAKPAGAEAAVAAVKGAKGRLDAATAAVAGAGDPLAALSAARAALVADGPFVRAYAAAARFYVPAKQVQLAAAIQGARTLASAVTALAAAPRPWLLAAPSRKRAYRQLQDNAAQARVQLARLDQLGADGASSDVSQLDAALAQVAQIRAALATLQASSTTAAAQAK